MNPWDVLGLASAALGVVALAIDAARYRATVRRLVPVVDLAAARGRE